MLCRAIRVVQAVVQSTGPATMAQLQSPRVSLALLQQRGHAVLYPPCHQQHSRRVLAAVAAPARTQTFEEIEQIDFTGPFQLEQLRGDWRDDTHWAQYKAATQQVDTLEAEQQELQNALEELQSTLRQNLIEVEAPAPARPRRQVGMDETAAWTAKLSACKRGLWLPDGREATRIVAPTPAHVSTRLQQPDAEVRKAKRAESRAARKAGTQPTAADAAASASRMSLEISDEVASTSGRSAAPTPTRAKRSTKAAAAVAAAPVATDTALMLSESSSAARQRHLKRSGNYNTRRVQTSATDAAILGSSTAGKKSSADSNLGSTDHLFKVRCQRWGGVRVGRLYFLHSWFKSLHCAHVHVPV